MIMLKEEYLPIVLCGYHWPQTEFENLGHDEIMYLALNMTSACNYRCPYCFVGLENLKASRDELTCKEMTHILREAKDCGARVVSLPGRGEPLADSDFWEILNEAERLGLWVVVYTNGYFLDKKKIVTLKDKPISLYLKVDSFTSSIYDELVGRRGAYGRISQNIKNLLELFHEPEQDGDQIISRLGINSVVTAQSAKSIRALRDWCHENSIYYTCRSPVNVGEAAQNWEKLVADGVESLRAIGYQYGARRFTSATELGQCGIYRFGITVDNNGELLVCPDAHHGFGRIGNIRENSLSELIKRRNELFPLDSSISYCFVKAHRNSEERELAHAVAAV